MGGFGFQGFTIYPETSLKEAFEHRNDPKISNLPIEFADKKEIPVNSPEISVQSNRLRDDSLESSEQTNESEHEISDNHSLEERVKEDYGKGINVIKLSKLS